MRVLPAILAISALALPAEEIRSRNVFYFGNSYTGNTMPGLHPLLAKSAGKEWKVDANIHPGVPIWIHAWKLATGGPDAARFDKAGPTADAIVMLHYCGLKSSVVTQMWDGKVTFDKPTDIGDAPSSIAIIERYLKLNPNGSAYVYAPWPGIPGIHAYTKRVQEEAQQSALSKGEDREAVMKKIKVIEPTFEDLEPARNSFDYAAAWLAPYDQSKGNPVGDGSAHSRAHQYDTMEILKAKFPDLWKAGRLGMIPVGDVFLEIDARMRAGKVPGLTNVGCFSTDGGHLRSGLGRYVLGATHYAVLFQAHPKEIDWKIYQDIGNYESKKHGFFVFQPDLGKHLDITPEIAAAVNDAIWDVVSKHPWVPHK